MQATKARPPRSPHNISHRISLSFFLDDDRQRGGGTKSVISAPRRNSGVFTEQPNSAQARFFLEPFVPHPCTGQAPPHAQMSTILATMMSAIRNERVARAPCVLWLLAARHTRFLASVALAVVRLCEAGCMCDRCSRFYMRYSEHAGRDSEDLSVRILQRNLKSNSQFLICLAAGEARCRE